MISFDDMLTFDAIGAAARSTGMSMMDDGTRALARVLSKEHYENLTGELRVREDTYHLMSADDALSVLDSLDFRLRFTYPVEKGRVMVYWRHGVLAEVLISDDEKLKSLYLHLNMKVRENARCIYLSRCTVQDGAWVGSVHATYGAKHILASIDAVSEEHLEPWIGIPPFLPEPLKEFVRNEIV